MDGDFRRLFVGLTPKFALADGRYVPEICFDNAATTPPLLPVLEDVAEFIPYYSSVQRGTGLKPRICNERIGRARADVIDFVQADPYKDTVVFVKNTTEAVNLLAYRMAGQNRGAADGQGRKQNVVIASEMEHHSNDLPWRRHFQVDYIRVDDTGSLLMEDLETKLHQYQNRVRLVAITGASNVTGYLNPVQQMATLAHRYGAEIFVDAAQLAPHYPIRMRPSGVSDQDHAYIDYLAFSAHKMYAPFGIGVLIGPRRFFEQGVPVCTGGGTVKAVTRHDVFWEDPPLKDEAGTPNLLGVVALQAAIRVLNGIGMGRIAGHEAALTDYAAAQMKKIPGIRLYTAPAGHKRQIGIIPFNLEGFTHEEVAAWLAEQAGIAVRNGCFCAHPYVQKLLGTSDAEMLRCRDLPRAQRPGMVRISFGLYNNTTEIDLLVDSLEELSRKGPKDQPK